MKRAIHYIGSFTAEHFKEKNLGKEMVKVFWALPLGRITCDIGPEDTGKNIEQVVKYIQGC